MERDNVSGKNLGKPNVGERGTGGEMRQGWHEFRSRVRAKWNDLTERDIDAYQGRPRDDLVGYIGDRTGTRREEVDKDVDRLARDVGYRFE